MFFNKAEYLDKVRGAWLGKTAGGTLGAPFECTLHGRGMHQVEFYLQKDLKTNPVPNDDLDLQLVWLCAAERHGIYQLTPQLLGEYWINHIIGPWNEYAVCRQNIANGFTPPLSGILNNPKWGSSNGAWIRSEIWALLFPGHPEETVKFAWMDSCADHFGEGIYAEVFTCAVESAAFVESEVPRLIEIGLSFIPRECQTAALIRVAVQAWEKGHSLAEAREQVVSANTLGWFQAPGNLAFMVLGLLFGQGDQGKTLCNAVNCGDDTDCTAATAGAIFGIIHGAAALPAEWIEPLGETIVTCSENPFGLGRGVPHTITELTERTWRLAQEARINNRHLAEIGNGTTVVSSEEMAKLVADSPHFVCGLSSLRLVQALPFGELTVEYSRIPEVEEGEIFLLRAGVQNTLCGGSTGTVQLTWRLPETWSVSPQSAQVMILPAWESETDFSMTVGRFTSPVEYLTLEIRVPGRHDVNIRQIPFQHKNAVRSFSAYPPFRDHWKFFDFYKR